MPRSGFPGQHPTPPVPGLTLGFSSRSRLCRGRRLLWAGAGWGRCAVQSGSAPPPSAAWPAESGWAWGDTQERAPAPESKKFPLKTTSEAFPAFHRAVRVTVLQIFVWTPTPTLWFPAVIILRTEQRIEGSIWARSSSWLFSAKAFDLQELFIQETHGQGKSTSQQANKPSRHLVKCSGTELSKGWEEPPVSATQSRIYDFYLLSTFRKNSLERWGHCLLSKFLEEGFTYSVIAKIYVNCFGPHKLKSRTADLILMF